MKEKINKLANIWANRREKDEKLGIVYTFSEPALETFADMLVKHVIKDIKNTNTNNSCTFTTYDRSVAECAKENILKMIKQEYNINYKFLEKEKLGL
jgi:hypothetical protein